MLARNEPKAKLPARLGEAGAPQVQNANSRQAPITQYVRGSQTWVDMFGDVKGLPWLTEHTASTVTAIHACVNLISGAHMVLPFNFYRLDVTNGERDRVFSDDLLWAFNEQMSPRWSAPIGWEYLSRSLLFEGDAFAIIKRDRAYRPVGLVPVHPHRVQNGVTIDGERMVYVISPEVLANGQIIGGVEIYDQDDMLHVSGAGFNGLRGMSPLRYSLRHAGGMALAMQDYSANFFVNGARPDYVLTSDNNISDPKFKMLQEQIDERHRGTQNSHRPMLLDNGLKVHNLTISAEDMQLLSTRQFQIEEVARAYGVPPFMIGHNEKTTSWGSGVQAMSIGFVRFALRQHLTRFAGEINRKIFRTAARVGEFDTTELEQADPKSLAETLRALVGRAGEPRIITPDEARAVLRRKHKGGDADELGVNVTQAGGSSSDDLSLHDALPIWAAA